MGGEGRGKGTRDEGPSGEAEPVAAVDDRRSAGENGENGGSFAAQDSLRPPLQQSSAGESWPDESAESAFLAETRERGEPVSTKRIETDALEETDSKALPPLDELVNRIPAEVRETLDELFRARFVTVKRVPKKALK